jgi:cell shape-determining protein MreC
LEKQKQDAEQLVQELEKERAEKAGLNEKLAQAEDEKGKLRTQLEEIRLAKEALEKKVAAIFAEGEVTLKRIIVRPSEPIEGKVIVVESASNIVVTDLGLKDGIKIGDILTVYRGDTFIAKMRVEKSEEDMSAGVVLTEWAKGEIQKEDNVKYIE